MSAIINRLRKCVAKIRIEGPLNCKMEDQIIKCINQVKSYRLVGIILMINSFGGSLEVAKNISYSLQKIRNQRQIPIYCFAQQFCLNSSNLILTMGTQCYANKFSIIGDFGYVYQGFNLDNLKDTKKIGIQYISKNKIQPYAHTIGYHKFNNQQQIKKWLNVSQSDLRYGTIVNRSYYLRNNNINPQQFQKKVLSIGTVQPHIATQIGLIDNILNTQQLEKTRFKGISIVQPQKTISKYLLRRFIDKFNPLSD